MSHALIFDSGVGGLSVVSDIRRQLPALYLSYVADDDFRPYGDKTPAQLQARLPELLKTLVIMLRPDVVVVACNTASTTALPAIRAALDVPVIGVVPAIKPAAQQSKTGHIGVLGTPGTVRRQYVDGLIRDFAEGCQVSLRGSTKLVEQAEIKLMGGAVDLSIVEAEISPLLETSGKSGQDMTTPNMDVVVLACTHFPLLREELQKAAGRPVQWIDSGDAIARRLDVVLKERGEKPSDTSCPDFPQTAFLIGPNPSVDKAGAARRAGFARYGFTRIVGLMGE